MKRSMTRAALAALLVSLASKGALAQTPPAPPAEIESDSPDPARPAPAGKGVVWGVITDAQSKEPLIEAAVTLDGSKKTIRADIDGRYRLELSPGTHALRVWYEGHKARKVQNITVVAGAVGRVDVTLDPDKVVDEVVLVEVTPERASAETQLLLRRNAAQVGDAVSAQEIAKTPDRNAADAARRVVGASVVGSKYVFVRGLGDRYTNALLNGTPLPSPEPDRQAIPLDLFPSIVLSDLTITKTFTPDMPGDFTGGSVRINTRELPEKFLFSATLSAGFNTQTTFAERPSYAGSRLDWLGIDGGARAFPKEIPDYKIVRLGPKPDGGTISSDEIAYYGKKMNSPMATTRSASFPNLSGNVVVGDTFSLGKGQELGFIAALSYGRKFLRKKDEILRTFTVDPGLPGTLIQRNDYRAETGLDQVSWGGYGTVTYKPAKNHKVVLTGFHSRSADNETREIEGFSEERGGNLRDQRLRFQSRSLSFGQLQGTHLLSALDDAVIDWNLSLSHAASDEPDTRETVYVLDGETGKYAWDAGTLSGSHFFATQRERAYGGGLDWTQALIKGDRPTKLRAGGLFSRRSRSFDARRFRYLPKGGVDPEVFNGAPDELFTTKNIGSALVLEEYTRPNDAYTADQNITSGYLLADTFLHPRVRVIGGARVESSHQGIDSFDPFAAELAHVVTSLDTTDLLPSFNVVIKTTQASNLRLSATRTVARPQLRELSPFVFTDYFGAREIFGNPALRRTSVYNGDVRFELFPAPGEVLALSLFYKQFYDPIEQIILPSNQGVISFQNAKGARAFGAEIEARKGLGFLSPVIADLGVLANVTLVHSRVELDGSGVSVQTNDRRALAGQSPYVINAGLDYGSEKTGTRARVLYNVFGPRIAQVGALGLPDVFEMPRHQLDLTAAQRIGKHLDLKLSAENLTNAPVRFTQGKNAAGGANAVNEYKLGATFTLGLTFSH